MENKKKTDPIPDEFGSYEEAAEFWDSHDTTDYLEHLTPVEVTAEFRGRLYELEIDDSSRVRGASSFFSAPKQNLRPGTVR